MRYIVGLDHIGRADIDRVGGKAAHLGELRAIGGVRVPDGFCITTDAFAGVIRDNPSIAPLLDALAAVDADHPAARAAISADVRAAMTGMALPAGVVDEVAKALARFDGPTAFAVRSSATAEDLPGASFAGQHDSYLDVVGRDAVLENLRRCWASLFTERAVIYRSQHDFADRDVAMAVIVQEMVPARAAGVMFTADPVTANRAVATVEAVRGLGDTLVSGERRGEVYRVRNGTVIEAERTDRPVLRDDQVVELVGLGRRIESYFGHPQDIEWCLVGDHDFEIVQSRAITTLYPIPRIAGHSNDSDPVHVYLSVGHQQMMTDAMRPLGISVWQLTARRPMYEAGGRLFVDVAPDLASAVRREQLLKLAKSDPLIGDALRAVIARDEIMARLPIDETPAALPHPTTAPADPPSSAAAPRSAPAPLDPGVVADLIARNRASVDALRRDIGQLSGPALVEFIRDDIDELQRILADPLGTEALMVGMAAKSWLDEHLGDWLGEKNASDALAQSVPYNVTAEMGLALLGVADVVRPHPELLAFLEQVVENDRDGDDFVDELVDFPGGVDARDALRGFLATYGMRGAGEIDVTRTRWSDRPSLIVSTILSNVRSFEPGEAKRRFDHGVRVAAAKREDVLARLRTQADGERKVTETARAIDRLRAFTGYREYPKFGMVSRYYVYRRALQREAERLVVAGVFAAPDDVYYLRLDELLQVTQTDVADHELIQRRRAEFRSYEHLRAPRVFTSDGEIVRVDYRRDDVPAGALVGLAVSAGVVEGRARVVTDMAHADLEPGDILVTAYTDPSWTPLFLTAAGLVTEVGGVMTHGAVIAREYGLPAVIGVPDVTDLIRDGERIRVDGAGGIVERIG